MHWLCKVFSHVTLEIFYLEILSCPVTVPQRDWDRGRFLILPAAPAAVMAASGRSPVTGVGAAAAAARAAAYRTSSSWSLVCGSAARSGSAPGSACSLRCWQLAGEPQWRRRRNRSGRRGRRLPLCRWLFLCWRRRRHDRFESGSLVRRPAFLSSICQVRHQLPGCDPAGVGG